MTGAPHPRAWRLDDPVGQRGQQHDHQTLPDPINTPGLRRPANSGTQPEGEEDGRQPDRQVDPEDRTPSDRADQKAADEGSEGHADPDHRRPDSDCLSPLPGIRERVGYDGHCDRVEHRPADRLNDPEHDRAVVRLGARLHRSEPAENTSRPAMNVRLRPTVGSRAREHEEAGQHQGVGIDRPLEARHGAWKSRRSTAVRRSRWSRPGPR